MTIKEYAELYKDNLLNDVIPFWYQHSWDKQNGGYFTCLDRQGNVYDTDKFIWLQARQVWTFSVLYNTVEKDPAWLNFAVHGADFLEKHGRDANGNWYFSLDRTGAPLVQPYNIFSDCFASMGFGQLYKATGNERYRTIALETFQNILNRKSNPKGKYSKAFPGTRPLKSLALPMIISNLVLEIEHTLDKDIVQKVIRDCIDEVMNDFYDEKSNLVLEQVTPEGKFSDSFEGRMVMPGHSLESMWFLMDLARKIADEDLIRRTLEIALNILEFGWDNEHGGIFYMLDLKGHPSTQLEWDQKLWWVHIEAIVCMLKGYHQTGDERCLHWFKKLHDYTWSRFPDKQYGEWFGYLNRQGDVLLPLKGGKWKGCFHIPRCLLLSWKTLDAIHEKNALSLA